VLIKANFCKDVFHASIYIDSLDILGCKLVHTADLVTVASVVKTRGQPGWSDWGFANSLGYSVSADYLSFKDLMSIMGLSGKMLGMTANLLVESGVAYFGKMRLSTDQENLMDLIPFDSPHLVRFNDTPPSASVNNLVIEGRFYYRKGPHCYVEMKRKHNIMPKCNYCEPHPIKRQPEYEEALKLIDRQGYTRRVDVYLDVYDSIVKRRALCAKYWKRNTKRCYTSLTRFRVWLRSVRLSTTNKLSVKKKDIATDFSTLRKSAREKNVSLPKCFNQKSFTRQVKEETIVAKEAKERVRAEVEKNLECDYPVLRDFMVTCHEMGMDYIKFADNLKVNICGTMLLDPESVVKELKSTSMEDMYECFKDFKARKRRKANRACPPFELFVRYMNDSRWQYTPKRYRNIISFFRKLKTGVRLTPREEKFMKMFKVEKEIVTMEQELGRVTYPHTIPKIAPELRETKYPEKELMEVVKPLYYAAAEKAKAFKERHEAIIKKVKGRHPKSGYRMKAETFEFYYKTIAQHFNISSIDRGWRSLVGSFREEERPSTLLRGKDLRRARKAEKIRRTQELYGCDYSKG